MKKILTILILALTFAACNQPAHQDWQLTSGTLPYADPDPIIYEGNVELTGWVVYQSAYIDAPEPHFHVANTESLPENFNHSNFQIEAPENIEEKILASTERSPIAVNATKIRLNIEGTPIMTFSN